VEDDMWKTNLAKTASKDLQEKIKKSSQKKLKQGCKWSS
jgi:hypothetical protein